MTKHTITQIKTTKKFLIQFPWEKVGSHKFRCIIKNASPLTLSGTDINQPSRERSETLMSFGYNLKHNVLMFECPDYDGIHHWVVTLDQLREWGMLEEDSIFHTSEYSELTLLLIQ